MPSFVVIGNFIQSPESPAYLVAPQDQTPVLELIIKKLRIKDTVTAEEGYHDLVRTMARKPYPSIAGMRNVQRLLKTQNPKDPARSRFMRKLDESGFVNGLYSALER